MVVVSRRSKAAALAVGAAISALPAEAPASPTFTQLRTGVGDGYVQVDVDEWGTIAGCSPTMGGVFDPLGPAPSEGTVCRAALQIFDEASTIKQALGPAYSGCGDLTYAEAPLVAGSDVLVGTHSRSTEFLLNGFPGVRVRLWQTACTGGTLEQTYTFINDSDDGYHLRLVRAADFDVDVFDYNNNYGWLLGAANPAVLDANHLVSVGLREGGDASFEGYRIYQSAANAAQIFYHVFGHHGFPAQNLNGFFRSLIYPWGSPCGIDLGVHETQLTGGAELSSIGDTAVVLQSVLDLPAHSTRTYQAETRWAPALDPNDVPQPNCAPAGAADETAVLSGSVRYGGNQCLAGPGSIGAPGRMLRVESGGQERFTFTNAGGDYSLAVTPGDYAVSVVPGPSGDQVCSQPANLAVTVAPHTLSTANDFALAAAAGCQGAINVRAAYPNNSAATHALVPEPCDCDIVTYCANVTNTGPLDITPQVIVRAVLPSNVSYVGMITAPQPPTSYANLCTTAPPLIFSSSPGQPGTCCAGAPTGADLRWFTGLVLPAGAGTSSQCSVCFQAQVCNQIPPPATPPHLTTQFLFRGCDQSLALTAFNEDVVCSRDPNFKEVSPRGCGPEGLTARGVPLDYTVHFENIGNGPAHRIVITDKLDPNLDPATIQILGASHPPTSLTLEPGPTLVWLFDGIELPPFADDPLNGDGWVKYRISPIEGLPSGTPIANEATIVFDRNDPMTTKAVRNTIVDEPAPPVNIVWDHRCDDYVFKYDGDPTGATLHWDFGDDASPPGTGEPYAFVNFATPGPHTVTLTVDRDGCVSTGTVTVDVPAPEARTTEYAVLARQALWLSPHAQVASGNAGVIEDDGFALVLPNAVASGPGGWLAARKIEIAPQGQVDDAFATWVNDPALVSGVLHPFQAPLLELPALPPITPGSVGVNLSPGSISSLAGGVYGSAWVGSNATLILDGGFYVFDDIVLSPSARIEVSSPSVIEVKGTLWLGSQSVLGPAPGSSLASDVVVYAGGPLVEVGHSATLIANVLAPDALVMLQPQSATRGLVIGRFVDVAPHAKLDREAICF